MASIYAVKSAMHIPLIVLGITPSSVRLTKHISQKLKHFDSTEIEFFSDYTYHLDKSKLARDPIEETLNEETLAESRLPTMETLLEHATGRKPETFEKEMWGHLFAHKSQKQVVKIEPEHKLIHAIGI